MAEGTGSRDLWLLLPRQLRQLPADLAAVCGVVALTVFSVLVPGVNDTPLRVLVGLPFVLFVPGYAFVAALFPEAGDAPTAADEGEGQGEENATAAASGRAGIDGIERVALSFGLSIAVVPLIGLVLNFTPWGIRLVPILSSVSLFTLIAVAVAAVRRWELPAEERFRVPYRSWLAAGRAELFRPESRADAALNVLLVLSILLATASVAYAVAVPKQGETFSELYLLTEQDDGELVAADYPTEFVAGESRELVVGIGNHEHERVQYTLIGVLQAVDVQRSADPSVNDSTGAGNFSVSVREQEEVARFRPTLGHNETWVRSHNVTPTLSGERLRLTYLLYEGSPPADPGVENAYREVHLWVNVSRPAA